MKKKYKKTIKPVSYKVSPSKYYNCYALVVNKKEIMWGDKKTMVSRREEYIRKQIK